MVSESILFAKYVFMMYNMEVLGENCPKKFSDMTNFIGFPPSSNSVFDLMSSSSSTVASISFSRTRLLSPLVMGYIYRNDLWVFFIANPFSKKTLSNWSFLAGEMVQTFWTAI